MKTFLYIYILDCLLRKLYLNVQAKGFVFLTQVCIFSVFQRRKWFIIQAIVALLVTGGIVWCYTKLDLDEKQVFQFVLL